TPYLNGALLLLIRFLNLAWKLLLPHGLWGIWKERNRRIFKEKSLDPCQVAIQIALALQENINLTTWTKYQQKIQICNSLEWQKLLSIQCKSTHTDQDLVCWTPPPRGWKKLNTDGASKGNPGKFGGGVILHCSSGYIVAASAHNFNFGSNHQAEALAILKGLEMAIKLGDDPLQVESDSLNIIKLLQSNDPGHWSIRNIITDIRIMQRSFRQVQFQHVLREGNKAADLLANIGVVIDNQQSWTDNFPKDLCQITQNDIPHC
ncbi:hypothetical protein KI387_007306, partial [Taxus chinensis]